MGTNASGTTKRAWFAFDRRDWFAFDRADYLTTKIVLAIAALGTFLFGLGGLLLNVMRINGIALIVGIGGMLAQFAQGMADNMIQTTGRLPDPGGLTSVFSFTPLPLVAMLAFALIGEVFRRGVVLRDDVEGLV